MLKLKGFKIPNHRSFNYVPRFWDEKKEEAEKLRERVAQLEKNNAEATKLRISSGFRRGYNKDTRYRSKQVFRSNMLLLAIIVVLLVLSYVLLNVYLPRLIEMM
ncbi:MAG: hypothetical protein AB8G15_05325 [Saprospiraceae bacterium]